MVILFRPYLSNEQTKEVAINNNEDEHEEGINKQTDDEKSEKMLEDSAPIVCRWMNCQVEAFANLEELSTHLSKEHSLAGEAGLFYCKWNNCNRGSRGFNARYKMLVHVRTHTNEKPHQCYQCNKSFSRAENLKIHCRSHTGERPYICAVPGCGKAYSNSSDRFKHSRTHTIEKPYVCKIPGCSKRYTDPSSLRKHVKTYKHYDEDTSDERHKDPDEAINKNYSNNITIGNICKSYNEQTDVAGQLLQPDEEFVKTPSQIIRYKEQKCNTTSDYDIPSSYQYKCHPYQCLTMSPLSQQLMLHHTPTFWCQNQQQSNNTDYYYSWHFPPVYSTDIDLISPKEAQYDDHHTYEQPLDLTTTAK